MLIIKLLAGIAFVGTIAWFVAVPDYEPAIAIVTSLSAFIAALIGERKAKKKAEQVQSVARSGLGIQAGGDVKIGSIKTGEAPRDAE
ncbi:MAG: hypothetical protein ABTQ25_07020 [Nitrosomonas ureae]